MRSPGIILPTSDRNVRVGKTRSLGPWSRVLGGKYRKFLLIVIVGQKLEISVIVIGESGLKMHSFYVISPQSESLWGPNIVFGCSTMDQMRSIFLLLEP